MRPSAQSHPIVHIVAGSTGAGKTTYSIALAQQERAVRFSIDEWMARLFWMDSPQPIQYEWAIERINRCEEMIFSNVRQFAAIGTSSVLDLGFTKASHREKFYDLARKHSIAFRLHFLDVPADLRWQRVIERNTKKGDTFVMEVDRGMFNFMEEIWEPPADDEMETAAAT
jgi:predicted kinase